jgi:hypothetical protein
MGKGKQRSTGSRKKRLKAVDPFATAKDKANSGAHIRHRDRPRNNPPTEFDLDVVETGDKSESQFDKKQKTPRLVKVARQHLAKQKAAEEAQAAQNGAQSSSESGAKSGKKRARTELDAYAMDRDQIDSFDSTRKKAKIAPRRLEGIREGESWKQFNQRIREESQQLVVDELRAKTKVSSKRKEYLAKRREKKKSGNRPGDEEEEDEIDEKAREFFLKPHERKEVKFGEQAQEPPKITVLPRGAVKKGDEHPLRQSVIDNYRRLKAMREIREQQMQKYQQQQKQQH